MSWVVGRGSWVEGRGCGCGSKKCRKNDKLKYLKKKRKNIVKYL